jgi:1-phosphofructokinase
MIFTFTANPSLDRTFVLERAELGRYNRGEVTRLDLGGKGINVSRNLRALGLSSVIVGFFGGHTGAYLVEALQGEGYEVRALEVRGESRSNITLVEQRAGRYTKFNEFGPQIGTDEASALLAFVDEQTKVDDVWVLSGSLPRGLAHAFYAEMIRRINDRGARAFLDSSGEALRQGCAARPHLVHMNRAEAEGYIGAEVTSLDDLLSAARRIQADGVRVVVLSRGPDSALLGWNGAFVEAVPPGVQGQNPVGAGDAMMAALVLGCQETWDLETMARWSVAAGTSSALGEGTSVAQMDQTRAFADEVTVRRLT